MTRSQSSSDILIKRPSRVIPALLTRISIFPNSVRTLEEPDRLLFYQKHRRVLQEIFGWDRYFLSARELQRLFLHWFRRSQHGRLLEQMPVQISLPIPAVPPVMTAALSLRWCHINVSNCISRLLFRCSKFDLSTPIFLFMPLKVLPGPISI